MKFEEAIVALKKGAKIRHSSFSEDEYLSVCKVGLVGAPMEDNVVSIIRIKNGIVAKSTYSRLHYVNKIKGQLKKILTEEEYKKYHNIYTDMDISEIFEEDIFSSPQINLLLVMSEEWERVE